MKAVQPYAYELMPSAHEFFWWARIRHESGTSSAIPALVHDSDLVRLQELWEVDDAIWVAQDERREPGFPEDWTVAHHVLLAGRHYMMWDFQRAAEGQRIRLRSSKYPHQQRYTVPFGGLLGTQLSDWVKGVAELNPLPNLDEWTDTQSVLHLTPLFEASAKFFRRVVLENRWVPHARELRISDENAELPIDARPEAR